MSAPHIFPTIDRPKHSKLLAYPIGAEVLSRALDGVPQHGKVACEFFAGNPHHEQNKRQLLYFMAITYEKVARSFHHGPLSEVRGVFDPRWRIHIHAVPAETRAAIKQQLIENILPSTVYDWLCEKAAMTGRTGTAALILNYDQSKAQIITEKRAHFPPEPLP